MDKLQMFVRLMKVDEATQTVSGIIANECVDHAGEVFDYDTSKDYFVKWSESLSKATDGKSVGNVRAMHGNIAAGKLTEMTLDDVAKNIPVVAHIVDPVEFKKCMEGVYTGFSIGGSYVRKWDDTAIGKKRYTANPTEVSLVDLPCNPDAQFTVNKKDGSSELRKYVTLTEQKSTGTTTETAPADAEPVGVTLGKTAVPLNTEADVRAAWTAYGPREDSADRQLVVKRWTECFGSAPPHETPDVATAKFDAVCAGILGKLKAGDEATTATIEAVRKALGRPELEKGMYDVSYVCDIFRQLGYAVGDAQFSKASTDAGIPAQLHDVLKALGITLCAMCEAETADAVARYETDEPMFLAKPTDGLEKATDVATLQKAVGDLQKRADVAEASLKKATLAVVEQNGALMKLREERDGLKKANDLQKAEIDTLKKTPAEPNSNPGATVVKAIGKDGKVDAVNPGGEGNGVGTDAAPVLKRDGSGQVDEVATEFKKIHAAGGRTLAERTFGKA